VLISLFAVLLALVRVGGQLLSHHVAVVRGWLVRCLIIILLWSVVGGQLRTRSLEGPFRGPFGKKS